MGNLNARESHSSQEEVGLDTITANVTKVHVEGIARTKEDLVVDNIKPIFNVKDFEDLVLSAQGVRTNLQALGCFSDVDIHIDTSTSGGPKDYEITFKVKELGRMGGSVNTMIGNQEGSLLMGIKSPNIFGRGEKLQFDYTHGTRKTSTFNAAFSKPLSFDSRSRSMVTSSIYQQAVEFPQSGFKELNKGALIDFMYMSAPQIMHNLQWEGVWREISSLSRTNAFAVREQCGHTLKSSLKHILTVDRRDNQVFPREGSLFKLSQEFAGIGGDIGYFKNEMEVQANLPLHNDIVIQGTLNCGMLKRSPTKSVTIADKFFLGGPLSIRGFEMRGIGKESEGNFLGGKAFWATGLHLFAPLPFRPGKDGFGDLFRSHIFATAGNLGDFESSYNSGDIMEEALRNFRWSYGVGIAFKLATVARIELNYCIPVKLEHRDSPAPGIQFGVGINFL